MSTLELRQLIQEFNRLDVVRADYKYLVNKFRSTSKSISIPLRQCHSTEFFFRARVDNSGSLDLVSQLQAPPASKVAGFQRCNPPGVPMFYAASTRRAALIEINAQAGDTVFLSQWIPKEPLPINQVFSSSDSDGKRELSPRTLMFHAYLDTIFTRPIHDSFSDAYKLTAAATEFLTTKFVESKEMGIRSDRTVGLRYPSVADRYQSTNTAFHADFARERLELVHVTKLRVTERTPDAVKILLIDTATEAEDGVIKWKGDPNNIPLPIKHLTYVPFISNGRVWEIPVFDRPPNDIEIEAFLSE